MMGRPLLVSLKDLVAQELKSQTLSQAFRQVEIWSRTVTPLLTSNMPAPTNPTITPGTAWQNPYQYDVMVRMAIELDPTGTAPATVNAGVGPTSPPATTLVMSAPTNQLSGAVNSVSFFVPYRWYLLVTPSNAVIRNTVAHAL